MTASEMEQRLGSFRKRDFRVWRRRQWWLRWHSLLDCSSRMLRIWIASSSEDSSCSQGYKKQGEQSQRPSFTPWSSMVCQWCMKLLLYRKALTRLWTSESWGKGCRTSMRSQHRGTRDKVVRWHWQWSVTSRRDPRMEKLLCVWDPWTLWQGLQEEGDSTRQQVCWERSPRQGMQETKRWRQTGVSGNRSKIGFTRRGILGSSYPVGDSRHASGQWLYRSRSGEHRCVPRLCAHSVSVKNPNGEASKVVGRGCVRISIPLNKRELKCELKIILYVPDCSSNLLSVTRCTEWGHSFTFEKGNSCMKLQKGTRVKLTQENNLFYLPCSVLEFKMSSNSVKLDSARKWHRRLGHLNQTDVVRNAPETVGNSMIYATCAHGLRSQRLQYQEWQRPKQKRRWRPFRVESLPGFRFCIVFADQYTKFVFVHCLRQRVKHWPAWKNLFSVWGRPRKWGKTMRRSFSQSSSRHTA